MIFDDYDFFKVWLTGAFLGTCMLAFTVFVLVVKQVTPFSKEATEDAGTSDGWLITTSSDNPRWSTVHPVPHSSLEVKAIASYVIATCTISLLNIGGDSSRTWAINCSEPISKSGAIALVPII